MSSEWRVTCDRCGKDEAKEFSGTRAYSRMSWWGASASLLKFTKQHSYDLCPECLKEFDLWIEKGPAK